MHESAQRSWALRSLHSNLVLRAAISLRSSPIRLAIALLDVSAGVETPVTKSSTLPVEGSITLIINEPSAFVVHVQDNGTKPHSIIYRISRAEIMVFVLEAVSIKYCSYGEVVKDSTTD